MLLIFTDLDGTLLNQHDYRYDAALPQLQRLKQHQIPVIPVTSKTRLEVEELLMELELDEPFIVENGSAVFIPANDQRFDLAAAEPWGRYRLMQFGDTYTEARQNLQAVAAALGEPLQGFADLSEAEISAMTGLPAVEVKRAKAREFTEPFVTPKAKTAEDIAAAVATVGWQVVVGDRFSHLIGPGAGKGKAVRWLTQRYRFKPGDRPTTVGLGNSPNDLSMLEEVEIPIVVPGPNGPHPGLADRGWQVAPAPGCVGWSAVIEAIGDRLLS